jgi:hypothetical protein
LAWSGGVAQAGFFGRLGFSLRARQSPAAQLAQLRQQGE